MKTKVVIEKLRFEIVEHPLYSPDLETSDYDIFRVRKRDLGEVHFWDDGDINNTVLEWFSAKTK